MTSGSRALGIGLLAGAAGISLLLILWLLVSGVNSGGFVLGLLLILVLGGPLAGAGWYLLSRAPAEQQQALAFSRKQRILDADRVFRAQTAAALRNIAETPALPTSDLRALADELQDTTHTTAAWQDLVQLDDSGIDTLRRYDDLVRERVRRLRDQPTNPSQALRELRQSIDQREDLLLHGRVAAEVAPSALLTTDTTPAIGPGLDQISLGDAISRDGMNFLVENLATYFAEGQRWKMARLVATSSQGSVQWLYVGPGALELALLAETTTPPSLPLVTSGTAVADVQDRTHSAQGVLVSYERYRSDPHFAVVERWPDAARVLAGDLISAGDLEYWPAAARAPR
jgi:hypothetical protein